MDQTFKSSFDNLFIYERACKFDQKFVFEICTHTHTHTHTHKHTHTQTFSFVQNAHAYVNAGFYMEVDTTNYTVKGKPSLVFGGISTHGVSIQTYLPPVQSFLVALNHLLFWTWSQFSQNLRDKFGKKSL